MKFNFDQYAHLRSPIHQWDARCKLIGLGALIFAFASVESLILVPAMVMVTIAFYLLSGLPFRFWLQRLRYPGFFLIGIVALLPFVSGETVIWQWGWVTVRQEGCLSVLLIASRFLCIITLTVLLFGTDSFLHMIKAMRSLSLPALLTDMVLLTYRYLYGIGENLRRMQQAMRLRGFFSRRRQRPDWMPFIPRWQELKTLAALTGTLLVRSYEQSERVYKAMRPRGYGQTYTSREVADRSVNITHPQPMAKNTVAPDALSGWQNIDRSSAIALGLMLAIAVGFLIADLLNRF